VRYLLLSDLHSNIEALSAVLDDATERGYDHVACMGDLVGYGADPNAVVDRVRSLSPRIIRGNHDKVISGVEDGEQFNFLAVQSCHWTREALSAENIDYLASLPKGPGSVDDQFWIAHGTPLDEDAYILNDFDAMEVFRGFGEDICFFGHSHIPTIFSVDEEEGLYLMAPMRDEEKIALKPGARYLINCGSVGQPRDRNPRAAYGIYDSGTRVLDLIRVQYALEETQRKILTTSLPRFLAERLGYGA